jgi:nucleoside-diphosphate-sugar epimerase
MNKILITGANSFIGNNFKAFSKFTDIQSVSLRDHSPESINFNDVDIVLHLAAIVHVGSKSRPEDYYRVNRDLSLEVARCARKAGVKQFIFMSSIKVYGRYDQKSGPWSESSVCNPEDYYGISKYEAEAELQKLNSTDFKISIIRTPLVYGKGVKANMLMLVKLVDQIRYLPLGSIENKRNFTYVENLVGFIDRIIELKIAGVFIAMDEKATSTTELVLFISKALNKKVVLFKMPSFLIKAGFYLVPRFFERIFGSLELENSVTRDALNYHPPYSTEEALIKMLTNFRN